MYHTDYSRIKYYKERMEKENNVYDEDFEGFSKLKREDNLKKQKKDYCMIGLVKRRNSIIVITRKAEDMHLTFCQP